MDEIIKDRVNALINLCDNRKNQILNFVAYLEETGYFIAPASTKYHNNLETGLINHSLLVTEYLLNIKQTLFDRLSPIVANKIRLGVDSVWQSTFCKISDESCVIVGLFHDVHKVCDGFGRINYLSNVLKSGKVSDSKPYESNKEIMTVVGSYKGVALVSKYIDLYEHEFQAIACHDGQYISANREIALKEHPLTLMLHFVDMFSAILIEDKNSWLYRKVSDCVFAKLNENI